MFYKSRGGLVLMLRSLTAQQHRSDNLMHRLFQWSRTSFFSFVHLIYKKADGDDGSWSYADYRNLTPVVNVEMVKNPYITGRYTATYDALPNGDYVMFAIAENYTIV